MSDFDASVVNEGDAVRVRATGELDIASAERLLARIGEVEGSAKRVLLDLSALKFMDSSGLRALIQIEGRSRRNGFEFVVVAPSPPVREVLEITRTNTYLTVVDDAGATAS